MCFPSCDPNDVAARVDIDTHAMFIVVEVEKEDFPRAALGGQSCHVTPDMSFDQSRHGAHAVVDGVPWKSESARVGHPVVDELESLTRGVRCQIVIYFFTKDITDHQFRPWYCETDALLIKVGARGCFRK